MSLVTGCDLNLTMTQHHPEWKNNILHAMQARVDSEFRSGLDIPTEAGGWWHQFVCPEHELPLIFDITSPRVHYCPRGCAHQGTNFDAAFRVFAHRHYAALARDSATLYQATANSKYLDIALEILLGYSERYKHFEGGKDSESWMLTGKAFHQALTESVWAIPLIQAFEVLQPAISPLQVKGLIQDLFRPILEVLTTAHDKLVRQQKQLESNYNAWLIAARGCLGFVLEDKTLTYEVIHGAGGFVDHLNAAVLPDGFEYEGSSYYHNFVTWAYTLLAEAARSHGMDLYAIRGKSGQSIERMWSALMDLVMPDGSLPSSGDGNYWQYSSFDAELCEVYEIALARTGDLEYDWLLEHAYRRSDTERASWAALMFADRDIAFSPRPEIKSVYLKDIGFGVLHDTQKNELSALMRFGLNGGGHTHLDCLAISLIPCSVDPGNPPYGVASRRSWYQQSAAHNVVIVDGRSQSPSDGRLLSWVPEPGNCSVEAAADDAYPGVKFSRKVKLINGQITDQFRLNSDENHIIDWLFHTDAALTCEGAEFSPIQGTLFPEGPGSFIKLSAKMTYSDNFVATFSQIGKKYRITLSSSSPMEIFLARSPQRGGVDMDERHTLVARVQGRQAEFQATYEVI